MKFSVIGFITILFSSVVAFPTVKNPNNSGTGRPSRGGLSKNTK